jgi:hypothetical protein
MNKLVIIGNGFDLAHNLKTSYNCFILWYFKKALEITMKEGSYEDKLISLKVGHSPFTKTLQINDLIDFKKEINSLEYSLKESGFFKLLHENIKEYNWVDIEALYYRYLVHLYNSIETDRRNKKSLETQLSSLNESLNCIKEKLIEYLNSISSEEIKENKIIANHINDLMNTVRVNSNSSPLSNPPQICFLNFNYTSTVELYLKKYNPSEYNYQLINIHGNLNDIDSIIFGYGDLKDANYENLENTHNNDFLKHVKHFYYFQRKDYHQLIRFIEAYTSSGNCKVKYEAFIMGHSCGVSDRMLLNRIFNPTTCNKIKIFYHQINETNNDFFEKTQNISRHLNKENKHNMEIICHKNDCKALS